MRLGVVWEPTTAGANYRARDPMIAMERRGHAVVWPLDDGGAPDVQRLAECDVVHVYRRADDATRVALDKLTRLGTPITYDNDDDFTAIPKESPTYKRMGGIAGQRVHSMTIKAARMASICTTTTEVLAEKYRRAGVDRVEVIPNQLSPEAARPRNRHEGVVIGWVAGVEHQVDLARLRIDEVLRRLLDGHPDVRVESIGVNLALDDRYRHDAHVGFNDLPRRIAGFDVAIAPLADIPWNRARSDIKLKEYAASGVPWLASPVGPYAGLGEAEGGRLVSDDGWFEALERLVSNRRERRRLGRKGRSWAKGQTIDAVAGRWEDVFSQASRGAPSG